MVDVAEQGFCMHCIRESGLLVRGDPRHEVARAGRRYWFPDASHRDAFLTSLRLKEGKCTSQAAGPASGPCQYHQDIHI